MKSHELAKLLLNGPNIPVALHTVNGFEHLEKIEIETESTILVINGQGYAFNEAYKLIPSENSEPVIMLISKSFGAV